MPAVPFMHKSVKYILYHEPQKFQCDQCAKSYSNKDALSYHIAKKHQVSVQKYSCDICGSRSQKNHARKRRECQQI